MISYLWAKIWTQDLRNTKQENQPVVYDIQMFSLLITVKTKCLRNQCMLKWMVPAGYQFVVTNIPYHWALYKWGQFHRGHVWVVSPVAGCYLLNGTTNYRCLLHRWSFTPSISVHTCLYSVALHLFPLLRGYLNLQDHIANCSSAWSVGLKHLKLSSNVLSNKRIICYE
jgi:hypothetical protein